MSNTQAIATSIFVIRVECFHHARSFCIPRTLMMPSADILCAIKANGFFFDAFLKERYPLLRCDVADLGRLMSLIKKCHFSHSCDAMRVSDCFTSPVGKSGGVRNVCDIVCFGKGRAPDTSEGDLFSAGAMIFDGSSVT